jgi:acetyltransferase-like isoleucine patch superfamily enzyme
MGALRTAVGTVLSAVAKIAPANAVRVACHRARGLRIGRDVFLGYDVNLDLVFPELIEIGDRARIGTGVMIFAHYVDADAVAGPRLRHAPVRIGADATLYAGAIVMPGVAVGASAIVRAGAVVEEDVPAFAIAAGVPARVVGTRAGAGLGRPVEERAMPP